MLPNSIIFWYSIFSSTQSTSPYYRLRVFFAHIFLLSSTSMVDPANPNATATSFVAFNVSAQAPLKLTSTNYTSWSFQFYTLLTGYNLLGFVDGSHPCPPAMKEGTTVVNPDFTAWTRQDQLILSAIIGSLSPTLIPLIATAKTTADAWCTLANTYDRPSRGRIMALKNKLHHPIKGTRSITEFMTKIKGFIDELSLLGVTTDSEDITLKILHGLDDSYKELPNAIQARDTSITFDELHEKLLTMEAQLSSRVTDSTPPSATAFHAATTVVRSNNQQNRLKGRTPQQ